MTTFASANPASEGYVLPKAGDVVAGKYTIDRVLGSGGMATVFLATHVQLGGRFAIKCLAPQIAEKPEFLARFLEEARASVNLRGEHSVRVYDVGVLDSGSPYIVMEYLRGCDLSQELDRSGPLPIVEAVDYVLQVCEALAEAHRLGIVHRDLKPGNLFLAIGPDGVRRIKVLDFGVSKRTTNDQALSQGLTSPSTILGSPQYMAPEQVRSARSVDARADIWSVGIVLFELVTDTCPFQGSTLAAIGATIVADEPVAPSSIRAEIPLELDALILRCLRKNPDDRFQNVHELAQALAPLGSTSGALVLDRISRISSAPAGHASPGPIKLERQPRPLLVEGVPSGDTSDVMAMTAAINVTTPTLVRSEINTLLSPLPSTPVSTPSPSAALPIERRSVTLPLAALVAVLLLVCFLIARAALRPNQAQVQAHDSSEPVPKATTGDKVNLPGPSAVPPAAFAPDEPNVRPVPSPDIADVARKSVAPPAVPVRKTSPPPAPSAAAPPAQPAVQTPSTEPNDRSVVEAVDPLGDRK